MVYRDYQIGFSVEMPDHFSEVREASYEVFNVSEGTLKYFIVLNDDGDILRSLSFNTEEARVNNKDEFLEVVKRNIEQLEHAGMKKVMNDTLTTPSGREIERYIMCDIDEEVDYGILIYFTKIKNRVVVSSTPVFEFFDVYETELFEIYDSIKEL